MNHLSKSEWLEWYTEHYGHEPPMKLVEKYYGNEGKEMDVLSIDIETYSEVDLLKCGVYCYATHPSFTVQLFAYSLNSNAVRVIDLANFEFIPPEIMSALTDEKVIKKAYNANFERICLMNYLKIPLDARQWRCTAVQAAICGLPLNLAGVAEALHLNPDKKKMGVGRSLINYFCKPNKEGKRNFPESDWDRWRLFVDYCKQDVISEMAVATELADFPILKNTQGEWELDQTINDRGVTVNLSLVRNAMAIDVVNTEKLLDKAIALTGLENPKSAAQIKKWLLEETGDEVKSLEKKEMPKLLAKYDDSLIQEVLKLRNELNKTSVKKYDAVLRSVCPDGKVRGLFQFYGANRTGRWAGRIVQVQNLPQNKLLDLNALRQLTIEGNYGTLNMLCDSIPSVLSQLIRTVFTAENKFIVVDFSAIEARILAWLADEKWRIDVFNSHGKIYEASASKMFGVALDKIKKGNPEYALRQKGKVAELALGYGGGKGALVSMGALDMGLDESELKPLVDLWRRSNPSITSLWCEIDELSRNTVLTKNRSCNPKYPIVFRSESDYLTIELPSGRKLHYYEPEVRQGKYGMEITYMGINSYTKKWERISTYGAKLVENIVQAIARDCLAVAMDRLESRGYAVVMHIHDEIVIEAKPNQDLQQVINILNEPIPWAKDLSLKSDGFEGTYYKKDD
jgi:DNA polymerase